MPDAAVGPHLLVTDLDGTLLDHHTYLPGPALDAVGELRACGVVVVPATSKTVAEIRPLARQLGLTDGWIAENGAVVTLRGRTRVLGLPYDHVRRVLLESAAAADVAVRGYGDMDDAEVASLTGLPLRAAARARRRQWTETFEVARGDPAALRHQLERRGLRMARGGRFFTASGRHDKGTATTLVARYLRAARTWAVGDAPNDARMLAAVDHPMLVRAHDGVWAALDVANLTRLDGIGPEGFVQAARLVRAGSSRPGQGERDEGSAESAHAEPHETAC